MSKQTRSRDNVVIRFAGDSGDGIQLTGNQFTDTTAFVGNDLGVFPDFPAEIRAPIGTVAGVSGFQIQFGANPVYTPGDQADALVVMNAAALKGNLKYLKDGGIIIANEDGFDKKNLQLAHYSDPSLNPLDDQGLNDRYQLIRIPITKLTREALKELSLGAKDKDRSKNMFVLGLLYWLYTRPLDTTEQFLRDKFARKPEVAEANVLTLRAGYHFGETTEVFTERYEVAPAKMTTGEYRGITGNQATAYGFVAAAQQASLPLYYGSYPITPASDILHELARLKNFGVTTFQAEDEIAAMAAVIGAAFGGSLAVTASSGPGVALKTEGMGLGFMLELPMVICNVQRGGPSTGLPTKTEQADLLQAVYGRNGEAPLPVVAAHSPSHCFEAAFEACRLALEFMTPVILLTDGYLANGAEPWQIPDVEGLPRIQTRFAEAQSREEAGPFLPYVRDEKLARPWAVPGTPGLEHRVGGLEKEDRTGHVSYDPENHEMMIHRRAEKIDGIARYIPEAKVDTGAEQGEVLLLGWGSTYGALRTATETLLEKGQPVSHIHLTHLHPLPANLGALLKGFQRIIVPELNNGQLVRIIRDRFLAPAESYTKIQGQPFTAEEVVAHVEGLLTAEAV